MAALVVGGCRRKEPADKSDAAYERMKKETQEAAEATRDYMDQKKEEFMTAMQLKLDELEKKWDELEQELEAKGKEADEEFVKQKQTFNAKIAEAKGRLRDAEQLSGEAWQGAKDAAQSAYVDLKRTYEQMAARYK
jgi:ElaB/YqjD/DUF883 family membrane-anchored ribosome-binding protein